MLAPSAHAPPSRPVADAALHSLLAPNGVAPLRLAGRELLPVVQGGMGIGVSAHRLAGSVAALGAVGTISSVDLRRHHPDLMERTRHVGLGAAAGNVASAEVAAGAGQAAEQRAVVDQPGRDEVHHLALALPDAVDAEQPRG